MPTIIAQSRLSEINAIDFDALDLPTAIGYCKDFRLTMNHMSEKLNQNSGNSSLSSSSDKPWTQRSAESGSTNTQEIISSITGENTSLIDTTTVNTSKLTNRADERKKREQGFSRQQHLPITRTEPIAPTHCIGCQSAFTENDISCYAGFNQADLVNNTEGIEYLYPEFVAYKLQEGYCIDCDLHTRATLQLQDTDIEHIKLSAKGLVGPTLASVITSFHKEDGTTMSHIQAKLALLYGITLAKGTIANVINHTGLCCEPTVQRYRLEAEQADLGHMDETTRHDGGETLWLWVFVTAYTCTFMMGRRTKQMAKAFLNGNFQGWLMSDGYQAYRHYAKRLRCWTHLWRKAKGLSESQLPDIRAFGLELMALMKTCMEGVYTARSLGNTSSIKHTLLTEINRIQALCELHQNDAHNASKALAREFLNDWEAIFRILDYPQYPLTNNEAERALRHWVILRKIIQGTQSLVGQRATCALASIIATGRRRGEKVVDTIKECIINTKGIMNTLSYQPLRLSG